MADQYIRSGLSGWTAVPGVEWGVGEELFDFVYYPFVEYAWQGFTYDFDQRSLNKVWSDSDYVYVAYNNGLSIISLISEEQVSYISYSSGFTDVWASDSYVFVSTSDDGVKYLDKTLANNLDATITRVELLYAMNSLMSSMALKRGPLCDVAEASYHAQPWTSVTVTLPKGLLKREISAETQGLTPLIIIMSGDSKDLSFVTR